MVSPRVLQTFGTLAIHCSEKHSGRRYHVLLSAVTMLLKAQAMQEWMTKAGCCSCSRHRHRSPRTAGRQNTSTAPPAQLIVTFTTLSNTSGTCLLHKRPLYAALQRLSLNPCPTERAALEDST